MDPDSPKGGPGEVTALLHRAARGDTAAADELVRVLEVELRSIASFHMRKERQNHTLQTTAVMNEALIRLLGPENRSWNGRQHFLAAASRIMRRILVDYARGRSAEKRRGSFVPLDMSASSAAPVSAQVLDVHAALEDFASIAPRQAQLVELRFFGGLSLEEAAEVLGISPRWADREWSLARAWLRQRLGAGEGM